MIQSSKYGTFVIMEADISPWIQKGSKLDIGKHLINI